MTKVHRDVCRRGNGLVRLRIFERIEIFRYVRFGVAVGIGTERAGCDEIIDDKDTGLAEVEKRGK